MREQKEPQSLEPGPLYIFMDRNRLEKSHLKNRSLCYNEKIVIFVFLIAFRKFQ
jgi:hypothetical protein